MSSQFKVISTFSGCGGSSLGYKMAGGKVIHAVEWDDNAAATYRANFPDTPLYHGDIHDLTPDYLFDTCGIGPGELDIFDGSPPCQGFSSIGKRKYSDPRNQLYHEYIRLLKGLQPKVLIMENVSGMVKGKMKIIFRNILTDLKASGYQVRARLMNAQYYSVPQSRQRMIFIGVRKDLGIEPSHPNPQSYPISVRQALNGVDISSEEKHFLKPESLKYWKMLKHGGFNQVHPKGHWFSQIKLNPAKPSPTICKTVFYCGSGLIHHEEPRYLTISELKRLASFPDSYIFLGKYEDQWARIGNSVPPLFMKAIASHVNTHILQKVTA